MAEVKYDGVEVNEVEMTTPAAAAVEGEKKEHKFIDSITEHMLTQEELAEHLGVDLTKGLTHEEAARRLVDHGLNVLTPPEREAMWKKFLHHVVGGFAILLWIGAILCFAVYGVDGSVENLILGIVLVCVVMLTGTFAFWQDVKAEKVLAGFSKLTPTECDVLREGETKRINAEEIVVGDVLYFEKGNKVPADLVMLSSAGVKVDNSSLTGESEPQKRKVQRTDENPYHTRNVAFFGTNVTEGNGHGVAVRCGDHTAIGQIADATNQGIKPEALMVEEINRFVKIISVIAISIGLLFLATALISGFSPFDSVIFTIGIIVANVPEGLLATVTLSLTITAQRMASKHVLVKNTHTVETLGSVNVIASDKTGTLTQNHMIVRHALFNSCKSVNVVQGREFTSQDILKSALADKKKAFGAQSKEDGDAADWQTGIHPVNPDGEIRRKNPELDQLILCAGLCNHATFAPGEKAKPIQKRKCTSDPSEGAILKFCHSHTDIYEMRAQHPEVSCIPFNSAAKWMCTIHKEAVGHRICIKGAPERVLERCSTHGIGNHPLTEENRSDIDDANTEVAENGERVLAFAEMLCPDIPHGFEFNPDEPNFPTTDFRFTGVLSMEDPPRVEVPDAVTCCHEAGIKVVMVTGDHPLTARNIATQVNIIRAVKNEGDEEAGIPHRHAALFHCGDPVEVRRDPTAASIVVTGTEVDKLDEEDWKYILTRDDIVFARTLPAQKQEIVARFQDFGNVVAVTGDGVNDAPALKKADVGIAMGSGSQVSHDAADMILMDDNFASIVKGIEEGRLIFVNLKKSIAYTLTSNIPEIVPFLLQIILGIPNALTTILILCIDLGTDLLPAISFSYETPESDIMRIPPRDRTKDMLVTWQLISWSYLQIGIIQTFAGYTVYFYMFEHYGDLSSGSMMADRPGAEWLDDNDEDHDTPSTCTIKNDSGDCMLFEERRDLLKKTQTAYLVSIVIMQIGCALACKTRMGSLLEHGMMNPVLNIGILQEVFLICMLVYAAFLNYGFGTLPIDYPEFMLALPFAAFLVFYDEMRKLHFRIYGTKTWFYDNFYY